MNETFAAVARRLAGLVPLVFGWRPHEFWEATPAELAALVDGLREVRGGRDPAEPLGRAKLAALMERDGDG
jgi:hypothetical protein